MNVKTFIPIILFALFQALNLFAIEPDTSATNLDTLISTGGINTDEDRVEGIYYVSSIRFFHDSVFSNFPDTMPFPEWDTKDIHIRKFDFSGIRDSLFIVLIDSNSKYTHPFKGNVVSEFDTRKWRFHFGVDIKLNTGDTVYCAFNGKVRVSTYSKTYGNVVVMRHDNGLETIYAHLSKRFVTKDSLLYSGEVVGLGGNTGRSYGSHLHFEVRYFDEAIDPRDVIDFEDYKLLNDTMTISECNFAYREIIKEFSKMAYHTIRSGNTLSHIAVQYGTSINTLCRLNGISRNKILRIGEKIRVR